jgi:protein TonB
VIEDTDQNLSTERFGFTVFLSACFHGILILGIGFTYLDELASAPAMEITLAQYRSELEPDNADFLAQENQIGSGTLSEAAAPSTPFESDFNADTIQEVQLLPPASTIAEPLEVRNDAVITSVRNNTSIDQQLKEQPEEELPITEETSADELSSAIASLQAQLDRQRQVYDFLGVDKKESRRTLFGYMAAAH